MAKIAFCRNVHEKGHQIFQNEGVLGGIKVGNIEKLCFSLFFLASLDQKIKIFKWLFLLFYSSHGFIIKEPWFLYRFAYSFLYKIHTQEMLFFLYFHLWTFLYLFSSFFFANLFLICFYGEQIAKTSHAQFKRL